MNVRIERLETELKGREERRKYLLLREQWYLDQLQGVLVQIAENGEAERKLEEEIAWEKRKQEIQS